MRIPLFPVFILLPALELWLMIAIGGEVGALAVIGWLVGMIIVGINLLRYLGASSMLRAAQGMQRGGALPAQSLADGLFKAIGAVLLIVPGFITDALAILCFIPWVRGLLLKRWMAKVAANSQAFGANPFASGAFRQDSARYGQGNVYEHQGSTQSGYQNDSDTADKPVLIDQQPESPSSNAKNPSDSKNG